MGDSEGAKVSPCTMTSQKGLVESYCAAWRLCVKILLMTFFQIHYKVICSLCHDAQLNVLATSEVITSAWTLRFWSMISELCQAVKMIFILTPALRFHV